MSALDKFYDFTLNLPDAKLTSKAMSLCNIDRNVFNIYLTLQEGKNNPILNADLGNYTVTMIVVKPKTKEYVEKVGVVDGSNDRLLFELGEAFNDQIGSYKGEIKVQNGNEVITSSSFAYTVTQSLISGLNAEIEASPDVEILRQLINEVKAVVGMAPGDPDSLLTEYQKKTDNTLTTTEKEIPKAINEVNSQIKDMAKDVLLEDGKLYLKKSDGTKLGTGVVLPLSGSGGSVTWESLTGKPSTFTPSSHVHNKSDITDFPTIPTKTSELNNDSGFLTSHQDLSNYVQKESGKGLSTNDLTTILKAQYDSAYTHSQSAHAPSDAQKNSDITKAEIEAKLTGEISSHSHANSGQSEKKWRLIKEVTLSEDVNSITIDKDVDNNSFALEELMILGRDVKASNSSQLMVSHSQGGTIVTTLNDFVNNTSKSLYVKLSHIGNYFLVQSRSSAYDICGIAGDKIADRFSNFHILCDINIFVSAGTKILANSKFEIWGR
ncbi:BppU family phage baseplate upper protein [Peptostreptococcus porci]|uniref:BppU family phage baseplate upper protein n=1 Tax=Peptostreptococcus porci TaxID=2652282 RepID=UPI002A8139C3|nr:BppU family phage baseplate upper protein [Peptostreptococcus porci]MDY4127646.1 BppU family phage baseplate upper protein [Peptostreptococcus porci]